jgi:hypothetical protein
MTPKLMAIISLNSVNHMVFIMETQYFSYEAEAKFLNIITEKEFAL